MIRGREDYMAVNLSICRDRQTALRPIGGPLQGPDLLVRLTFPWVENPRLFMVHPFGVGEVLFQ